MLSDQSSLAAQITAVAIAHVAFIELPANEWPELVQHLLQGASDPANEVHRASSLHAIGLIAENLVCFPPFLLKHDIDCRKSPEYIEQHSGPILTAVMHGIRKEEPSEKVRIAAIKALYNALGGIRANFEQEGQRHFIMQTVCEATTQSSHDVQYHAFTVLVKIMDLYYEFMEVYMQQALFGVCLRFPHLTFYFLI